MAINGSNRVRQVSTRFLSTLAKLIRLRVFDLRWILWLVWENVAPGRLAGVVVLLLPLRLRDGHTQNFPCTPKSVEKPLHIHIHRETHTRWTTNIHYYMSTFFQRRENETRPVKCLCLHQVFDFFRVAVM